MCNWSKFNLMPKPREKKQMIERKEELSSDDLMRIIGQGGLDSLTSEEIVKAAQELNRRMKSDPKFKAQILDLTVTREDMTTRLIKNGIPEDIVFD